MVNGKQPLFQVCGNVAAKWREDSNASDQDPQGL